MKENLSDLGTKIPESEARSDRVSRLGIVTVTSRLADTSKMELSRVAK